jgi:hypothetical protein
MDKLAAFMFRAEMTTMKMHPQRHHEFLTGEMAYAKILPETLTLPQLLKKFPAFYGTRKFITAFTTARHLSPVLYKIDPVHAPIQLLEDPFRCYPPIYARIFQIVSVNQVSPLKPCMNLYSPLYVLRDPPNSFFWTRSPE